ncbi:ATP-binding protein [Sinorhizobium psoraleae]|uniref:ATP-dependent DNA helicase RecG C-terminal domain-containing protein n=1 Tax=Sinorhizobium psoraleae TaxID=520838 RepID=A0ABT4KKY4_9HYPH|nr:ATP-binding protein [Sinorhizobium psoraleae]MCZ4092633.1 hypothetical protein [Sinorhizobium psoraleae]
MRDLLSSGYSKGAEPYEVKAVAHVEIQDISESKVLHDYMSRVQTHLQPDVFLKKAKTDGGKLVKLQYPSEALKEILVNAVIHRDYSLNDDIHVRIFDNRIEVQSPGKLPGYMKIENLYEERFSRNPNVVRMLHNLPNPVNHDIGEGLDTAKNELKKAGLVDPIFQEKENAFLVIVKHQK